MTRCSRLHHCVVQELDHPKEPKSERKTDLFRFLLHEFLELHQSALLGCIERMAVDAREPLISGQVFGLIVGICQNISKRSQNNSGLQHLPCQ